MEIKSNLCGAADCGPVEFCSEECGAVGLVSSLCVDIVNGFVAKFGKFTSADFSASKDRDLTDELVVRLAAAKGLVK